MKTENMKLLDLQTGKYLELGKDWLYGGECIYVIPTHCFVFIKSDQIIKLYYDDEVEEIQCEIPNEYKSKNGVATAYIDGRFTKYVINGEEFKCGQLIKCGLSYPINDAKICNKSEPQGTLKTLCDKTGAVIYGDRYVLLHGEQDTSIHEDNHFYTIGDVVVNDHKWYGCVTIGLCSTEYSYHNNVVDIPEFRGNCESGVLYCKFEILGNFFEEYSKQLRKEENKFDELMEKLK
jgi:hypothetical protein